MMVKVNSSESSMYKDYFIHLAIFFIILVAFMISSKTGFSIGILAIFLVSLLFIKRTKSWFILFLISLLFINNVWSLDWWFHLKITHLFFIIFFISFWYCRFRKGDLSVDVTWADAPLLIFLMITAISVFQSRFIGDAPMILYDAFRNYPWVRGLLGVILLSAMYAVFYTTLNMVKDKKVFKEALFILIMNGVVFSMWGLIGFLYTYITSTHLPSLYDPLVHFSNEGLRIKSVAGEPLFFGGYILSVLPVVYCMLLKKGYFSRKFLVISSLILTLAILLTVSRGAWFGFIVLLACFIFWGKLHKIIFSESFLKAAFFILVGIFIIFAADSTIHVGINEKAKAAAIKVSDPITSAFNPVDGRFWSTRVRLWSFEYAWDGFKQHPLLGIGYENYAFYSGNRFYEGLLLIAINFPEVNNFPLKILSETGLIGFIAIIWLFMHIILKMRAQIKQEQDNYLLEGYFFAFIVLCAQLLFFSYIYYLYIWVMLAMMMSLTKTKRVTIK